MSRILRASFAVIALWLSTPVKAQEASELRQLIQTLQAKVDAMENNGVKSNSRVTELGASRASRPEPVEEPLSLRIYDLSDLFSIAPTYAAELASDLSPNRRPLFPVVSSENQEGGGMGGSVGGGFGGGGGGFGGGGMGGGGGSFSVPPGSASGLIEGPTTLHQFGGGGGTGVAGGSDGNLAAAKVSISDLISVIEATINPEEWSDTQGGPHVIRQLGSSILVKAKRDVHDQIDALLTMLRERWGSLQTVSIRAFWVSLNPLELEPLVDRSAEIDGVRLVGIIDRDAWQNRLAKAEEEGASAITYEAQLTCYSGQTVHLMTGAQQVAVSGMVPVVSGEAPPAYQPTVAVIQEGATLQVSPLTKRHGKFVTLDVHSRVIQRVTPTDEPANDDESAEDDREAASVVAALDRPHLAVHRLSTTLRLPLEKMVVVGGMTGGADPSVPAIYLVVEVAVQEWVDDLAVAKPASPAKR